MKREAQVSIHISRELGRSSRCSRGEQVVTVSPDFFSPPLSSGTVLRYCCTGRLRQTTADRCKLLKRNAYRRIYSEKCSGNGERPFIFVGVFRPPRLFRHGSSLPRRVHLPAELLFLPFYWLQLTFHPFQFCPNPFSPIVRGFSCRNPSTVSTLTYCATNAKSNWRAIPKMSPRLWTLRNQIYSIPFFPHAGSRCSTIFLAIINIYIGGTNETCSENFVQFFANIRQTIAIAIDYCSWRKVIERY